MTSERHVILLDGTIGIVRPIIQSDKDALVAAFEQLDPESRVRRFFFKKTELSDSEATRFTTPDGIDHIAYGLAVCLEEGTEWVPIAVAHCFRDEHQKDLAEVAVVTADLWQGNGAGVELMRSLCAAAAKVGIRRLFAAMFSNNIAMKHLLDRFGIMREERDLGNGIVEVIYDINEPPGGCIDSIPDQAKQSVGDNRAEQDGADQPATAPESKPEGNQNPNPESEVRPQ